MPTGTYSDNGYVPGTPIVAKNNLKAFTVAATTGSIIVYRLTGVVLVKKLYGIVETALSANITAAHFRLNDQTAQPAITLATGTTLSACVVGQRIAVRDLPAVALEVSGLTNTAKVLTPAVKQTVEFQEFELVAKTGVNNDLEFRYTTTDNPSSGAIRFYIEYQPLSTDGALAAQ